MLSLFLFNIEWGNLHRKKKKAEGQERKETLFEDVKILCYISDWQVTACRPDSAHHLFLYSLHANNDFYIFSGLKKPQE